MTNSGMSTYKIYIDKKVKKDLKKISREQVIRIIDAISQRLTTKPHIYAKPLYGSLNGFKSLRVGNYRVIFGINKKRVEIWAISHRATVYKQAYDRLFNQ